MGLLLFATQAQVDALSKSQPQQLSTTDFEIIHNAVSAFCDHFFNDENQIAEYLIKAAQDFNTPKNNRNRRISWSNTLS